jgi:P4 family phage/plasmid primase-like protien
MQPTQHSEFTIREYAVGSLQNRNSFESLKFAQTLQGNRETYQSYFLHTNQIQKYAEAQRDLYGKLTVTGYKGVVHSDRILIDIDVKDDLTKALGVARNVISQLNKSFNIPSSALQCKFSGSKGFHLEIPTALFAGLEVSATLPSLHKEIVTILCRGFEEYIDTSIYHTVGLIRVENTINDKTGLFSIPLTVDEINSFSIDDILARAKQPRQLEVQPTEHQLIDGLVELKKTATLTIQNEPPVSTSVDFGTMYSQPSSDKIDTVFNHCRALSAISGKSSRRESIGHEERVTLGTVLSAFGNDGYNKVHALLAEQENYDKANTSYYLEAMKSGSYKPELCLTICGRNNLCTAIRAINRRSPIAFAYTYNPTVDEKIRKFIESYALDKIVAHFTDIIYSLIDQSYYRYADGVYTQLADGQIKSMLNDFLPFYFPKELITNTNLNALVERLKSHSDVRYEGRFNSDMYRVNLKNGIFDLRNRTLSQHSPKFMSNIQLPFSYDPSAISPVFDGFLNSIFDSKEVEDYILKIWCYLLLPTYSFQKIFVWYGNGRNGKGVLSRIIEAMIGTANSAHEDIHELANGRFSTINLKDKLVNFSTELKTNELDLSMLKKLSGGDMIAADKKYKDKITFQNVARLIILANELPRFSEIGQAITQRFEFIEFPKNFFKEQADTLLDEKLRSELSGIFNRVIGMMPEILDGKGAINFNCPEELERKKEAVLSSLTTVIEFVNEKCKKNDHSSVASQQLYDTYRSWGRNCGYQPVGKKTFNGILRETLHLKVDNNSADANAVHVYGIERIDKGFMLPHS